jgi:DNA-binding winged helix-turn-helix (wHTH) protein
MNGASIAFDRFVLDRENRLLLCDGAPVELSARYLDALALLASDPGGLVTKDRFMDEVWRGVPVTDEALTQCVKTLRRALGDDAARPRFIETVPKHGYRFIAAVGTVAADRATPTSRTPARPAKERGAAEWQQFLMLSGAGVVGGGIAGLIGGLFYGFAGAAQPLQPGIGAGSTVLVLTALTVLIALTGAAGVSLGIAAVLVRGGGWLWHVAGGAIGGLVVGGVVKLLGLDAFNLLLGVSPGNITGALEGAALGAAVALGVWFGEQIWRAALIGLLTGMAITALGGRLLGGSLELLAGVFPQSRLQLGQIGALFGEDGFGRVSQIITGGIEGLLFAACIAYAMLLAQRQIAAD